MLLHFQDCTTAIPKFHQFWSFLPLKSASAIPRPNVAMLSQARSQRKTSPMPPERAIIISSSRKVMVRFTLLRLESSNIFLKGRRVHKGMWMNDETTGNMPCLYIPQSSLEELVQILFGKGKSPSLELKWSTNRLALPNVSGAATWSQKNVACVI